MTQMSFLKEEIKKSKSDNEEKNHLIFKVVENSKPNKEKRVYEDCIRILKERFQIQNYSTLNTQQQKKDEAHNDSSQNNNKKGGGFLNFFK